MSMSPPVVDARRKGTLLIITCPYCGKQHIHGGCGDKFGEGDGHRVAHCQTLGNDDGYILKEV